MPPFGDEAHEPPERPRPTLVLWRCRRCLDIETVPAQHPLITVREATERGGAAVLRTHQCADGTGCMGVLDLIGTGVEMTAADMTAAEMLAGRSGTAARAT